MTVQNYSCMPALVPQLPQNRAARPIIQNPSASFFSPIAPESRLSTILDEGMEALYYTTFLKEEAAAVCQEIYRVTLLSVSERAAQMLFCQQFCLTLTALPKPSHKEDLTIIYAVLKFVTY